MTTEWTSLQTEHFEQVWSVLNKARLLTSAKLQWLSDTDIKMVIAQALKENPNYDEDDTIEEALQEWLKGERDNAQRVQMAEAPAALREWEIDKYAYGLELERRKRARLAEEAV